jgi:hypothetical protein
MNASMSFIEAQCHGCCYRRAVPHKNLSRAKELTSERTRPNDDTILTMQRTPRQQQQQQQQRVSSILA